ncbi:hypothetical protein TRIUR3_22002 [Triticum urartu]|uniref:Uncharacterized protein n=1 Tax=Triticum urartu TaxID=4572 RepID=M7YMN9_TRIUA|nr:hypothetical protein TRIUR3_22002 [Triticum urartu]
MAMQRTTAGVPAMGSAENSGNGRIEVRDDVLRRGGAPVDVLAGARESGLVLQVHGAGQGMEELLSSGSN